MFKMNLSDRISKINKEYSIKEKETVAKLNEERNFLIAEATVNEIVERANTLPIGDLFTIFENISEDVLLTNKGKSLINKYISTIKENAALKNEYFLINNVAKSGAKDAKGLVTESLELVAPFATRKHLLKGKSLIASCVTEALQLVNPLTAYKKIAIDENTHKLHENIEYLSSVSKSVKTVAEYRRRLDEMIECMKISEAGEVVTENKKAVFDRKKNDCLTAIDEAWENANGTLRMTLTEIKDRLEKKEFSEVTADEDIKYINELTKTLA